MTTVWIAAGIVVAVAVVAAVVVWASASGRLMLASKQSDGTAVGKCPSCGSPVPVSEIKTGQKAFVCAQCGEEAVWT